MSGVQILEELSVFTPLGIRFWDPVGDEQIQTNLRVRAWPATGFGPVVEAFRTASDIYAFHGLPGLLSVEYRLSDPSSVTSPASRHRFVVQVEDNHRRFLPAAFGIDLPLAYAGVFPKNGLDSPAANSPPGFLLYSAPTRTAASWLTAVRGELVEMETGQPASHAVVQVRVPDERSWFGLADEHGQFAVYLPYPTLTDRFAGSPPNLAQGSLFDQTWQIVVTVYSDPRQLEILPRTPLPDYLSILRQTPASVWGRRLEDGGAPEAQWSGELEFGTECILRTEGLSHLLVSPPASSP